MPHSLDLSLGCIFIGVILNVWLYGFSCVQAYIYYSRFKSDKTSMRAFVALLFTADTFNTIIDIVFLYKYVISYFGDLHYASLSNNEFATDPVLVSLIGFMTQLFFAWRVWKLTSGRSLPWIVALSIVSIGFLSFIAAIGTTVGVVIVREFARFQTFQVAVIVWLAGAAVADAIITVSLIITLHKARTGFAQTDDVISKLIRGTLQTGLLTASFAIIDLILFLASPTTLHLIFNLPLAKLYVNSLLSTLNARAFTNQARYTMHSSALRNMGANNILRQAESGQAQSNNSVGKGGAVGTSSGEATAVSEGMADKNSATGKKAGFLKSLGGAGVKRTLHEGREDGIHILTIEERFESELPASEPQSLPYASGRVPRTPGDSRKSTEDDQISQGSYPFGATQETLSMAAYPSAAARAGSNSPDGRRAANHPYNQF